MLIAGDDLFVSDYERLATAVKYGACNSVIIKPDQAGTFTNLLKIVDLSKKGIFTHYFTSVLRFL